MGKYTELLNEIIATVNKGWQTRLKGEESIKMHVIKTPVENSELFHLEIFIGKEGETGHYFTYAYLWAYTHCKEDEIEARLETKAFELIKSGCITGLFLKLALDTDNPKIRGWYGLNDKKQNEQTSDN